MAKSEKKTKKASAKTNGKAKKLKIPKQVGTVKIPKELRKEGNRLIEALQGALTAQATAAAFNALSRITIDTRRRPH